MERLESGNLVIIKSPETKKREIAARGNMGTSRKEKPGN